MSRRYKYSDEYYNYLLESLKGHTPSEETKAKISQSLSGIKRSDEFKSKVSQFMRGNKYALGCKRSEEVKAKMSQSHINHPGLSKVVGMFDLEGNLLRIFPSANQVQRDLGYDQSNVSTACRSNMRKTYKGYYWAYLD